MSYGVALRNGVPFTLGTIAALCTNATGSAWSPLALWPNGIASPGMWISPRTLTSEWQDYTGTTPVSVPGTVADASNPVGLALDIRAGATVLTDPGNHMLQATSTARPLLSARVNLLTYTEDIPTGWGPGWYASGNFVITNGFPDPSGGNHANKYEMLPGTFAYQQIHYVNSAPGAKIVTMYMRGENGGEVVRFERDTGISITLTTSWERYEFIPTVVDGFFLLLSGNYVSSYGTFYVWHPQMELGTTATDYQPILTDGSSYPSTGFPTYQKYDGTDDGMATAAFSAGTLIDGMDCLIAVRRDSAAATYLISNTGSRGFFEWESGDTNRPDVSAGTPTYYVDGVAVTATRGALFTALTAGDWHILEARGLDLSTWTALEVSSLVSYRLNGPRGDILLYPSTTPTADKDAARQWLADYYGVTLP